MTSFIADTSALLARSPEVLRTLLIGLPEAWTETPDVADDLVERFAELRTANLTSLSELVADADLDRRGMHPTLGEVTLRELLAAWAVHDLDPIGQIYAGLAGSREADVGPWKAYLGLLLRREDPSAVAG
jgi:hypothetical protein